MERARGSGRKGASSLGSSSGSSIFDFLETMRWLEFVRRWEAGPSASSRRSIVAVVASLDLSNSSPPTSRSSTGRLPSLDPSMVDELFGLSILLLQDPKERRGSDASVAPPRSSPFANDPAFKPRVPAANYLIDLLLGITIGGSRVRIVQIGLQKRWSSTRGASPTLSPSLLNDLPPFFSSSQQPSPHYSLLHFLRPNQVL